MSRYSHIYYDVQELIKEHGTRDPKEILIDRGVELIAFNDECRLLGMYKIVLGKRFVFYNPRMDKIMTRMVFAHELGHDFYHRDVELIPEHELFHQTNRQELEANIFAAHLLIDDENIKEYLERDYTYNQMAQSEYVNPNLIILKLNEMKKLGFNIKTTYQADNLFFSHIDGKDEAAMVNEYCENYIC